MPGALLEVNNLTVRYEAGGPRPALWEVSFSLGRGERLALTGNNGAGKSTLLLALAGVLPREGGGVFLEGVELRAETAPAFRRRIALVMQNPDDQLFMPSVYDDIAFGPRSRGTAEPAVKEKAAAVMRSLGIAGLGERLTHRLSGGEKRLAALAGALVMEPDILLLDEPAAFLDPPGRERLMEILSGLAPAMLIATHDLDMARRLCGGILRLEQGRLVT